MSDDFDDIKNLKLKKTPEISQRNEINHVLQKYFGEKLEKYEETKETSYGRLILKACLESAAIFVLIFAFSNERVRGFFNFSPNPFINKSLIFSIWFILIFSITLLFLL